MRTSPATQPPAPTSGPAGTVPGVVVDVECSAPLPRIDAVDADGRRRRRAWLLVRVFTEPVGLVVTAIPDAGLSPDQLAWAVDEAVGPAVRHRASAAGVHLPSPLPAGGFAAPGMPTVFVERAAALGAADPVTVAVCTRDRPHLLARCLDALLGQDHPDARILVVDNAPSSGSAREVAAAASRRGPVEYVVEPRPGLSWARNRSIEASSTELIAWIDDDEVADPYWLAEIARAFWRCPMAGAVTGTIVPAEVETVAQEWFEQFGGHSKGRQFTPAEFSPATAWRQSPLFPLPPFGAGGNMAFRRSALEAIGRFDTALGAGTRAKGCEDTLAFTRLLLAGGTIAYTPGALVRHYHYRELTGLSDQMHGYGVGLTAYYTSLVLADPRLLLPLAALLPAAVREVLGRGEHRTAGLAADFPRELLARNRRGMATGAWAYLRSRRDQRRLAAAGGPA